MFISKLLWLSCFLHFGYCDIYIHNPRGSNNRLNERSRPRRNANRLFDSQNNKRGGYNQGNVYFISGSQLRIEWTHQHGCDDENSNCNIIIQYMCSPELRDGRTEGTIPHQRGQFFRHRYHHHHHHKHHGMHEDNRYYSECFHRHRNHFLFTADQKLKGSSAIYTRQNPNGQRRGLECPEERDYYPYWGASPWRDIAILTNDVSKCDYYRKESANVKNRYHCLPGRNTNHRRLLPITREHCQDITTRGIWTRYPSHRIDPPICRQPEWTRDNHLGNTKSGQSPSFNWTVPFNINPAHHCALRIRYNITTKDFDGWNTDVESNHLRLKYGFDNTRTPRRRGYRFRGNPKVQLFPGRHNRKFKLQLSVNTAQFGRVFQDRTHSFQIREQAVDGPLHNVNVRGKRGNIVQVYPAVEYDFVPNTLEIKKGEYVHFQWTGSNTNPHNNDGEGTKGTDRNNVIMMAARIYPKPKPYYGVPDFGDFSRSYPHYYQQGTSFWGISRVDVENLAFAGVPTKKNNALLNHSPRYFDLGPKKITSSCVSHYFCTRNNNFSNRSQKGRLIVRTRSLLYYAVGEAGGTFASDDGFASVIIPPKSFFHLVQLRFESWSKNEASQEYKLEHFKPPPGSRYLSDIYVVAMDATLKKPMTIGINVMNAAASVYRGDLATKRWTKLQHKTDKVRRISTFTTTKGGIFVFRA